MRQRLAVGLSPVLVGGVFALGLFLEEARVLRAPPSETAMDMTLMYSLHPQWLPPLVIIGALLVIQLLVTWPLLRRAGSRRAQWGTAILVTMGVTVGMAAVHFAPEVDTWWSVGAASAAIFGLPVLLTSALTLLTLPDRSSAV